MGVALGKRLLAVLVLCSGVMACIALLHFSSLQSRPNRAKAAILGSVSNDDTADDSVRPRGGVSSTPHPATVAVLPETELPTTPLPTTTPKPTAGYYSVTRKSGKVIKFRRRAHRAAKIVSQLLAPVPSLHAFYYPWYGNPDTDDSFVHWNHPYLPHWQRDVTDRYPKGIHVPPQDIGSTYYPLLGPYSSSNETIIKGHMRQLKRARIGTIVVSWYPREMSDPNGIPSDELILPLLDAAAEHGIAVCFHSEPYEHRSADSLVNDLKYIAKTYGDHPALLRMPRRPSMQNGAATGTQKLLPVVYVYDAYLTTTPSWAEVFSEDGARSIRGTDHDAVMIGLLLETDHMEYIEGGGFDGVYTYFASNTFTFGSNWGNWGAIAKRCHDMDRYFVPSVGPGYDDLQVRPWNQQNVKDRGPDAHYYNDSWTYGLKAAKVAGGVVSITSFNEWHEGTQIEAAVPFAWLDGVPQAVRRQYERRRRRDQQGEGHLFTPGGGVDGKGHREYNDYAPHDPHYFLDVTAAWAEKMV